MGKRLVLLFVAMSAFACGDATDESPSSGATGAGGSEVARCPDAEPTAGDPCPSALRSCMYGDSVLPNCRRNWSCDRGKWTPQSMGSCSAPVDCPTAEPVDGAVCAQESDICTFGNTICVCTSCPGAGCVGPPPIWGCFPPPGGGCPPTVPNLGSRCGDEGIACSYGGGSCRMIAGAQATCTGGVWEWGSTCF